MAGLPERPRSARLLLLPSLQAEPAKRQTKGLLTQLPHVSLLPALPAAASATPTPSAAALMLLLMLLVVVVVGVVGGLLTPVKLLGGKDSSKDFKLNPNHLVVGLNPRYNSQFALS